MMAVAIHYNARTPQYTGGPKRFPVPDDKVPWSVSWSEYEPVDYTAQIVYSVMADPDFKYSKQHGI